MKSFLLVLGVFLLFLTGCGNTNYTNSDYSESDLYTSKSSYEPVDLSSYLEVSNLSVREEIGLVNVIGAIKNNYTDYIDEIGDIAFFDESGNLIRVKKMHIQLGAGETMYFEELVGQSKELTSRPASVELSGF